MTIAITGGTGFVGQSVLDRAGQQKLPVRALARTIPAPEHNGVMWVQGGLSDVRALDCLMQGAEAVIHIAGLTNTPDPGEFELVNVLGTQAVLDAAKRADITRFVFVSSLSAREPELSAYGASKARAEKLVAACGLDWTIIRPPAVYGPRDRDMFELFRAARWGVVPLPPPGRTSLIHVQDLADLLLALTKPDKQTGTRIFEPDDGHDNGWSHQDMAKMMGDAFDRKVWAPHLPKSLLQILARADGAIRRGHARLTPDRVGYMTHPDWVARPSAHIPPAIWQARISAPEGFRSTAQWYRANNWL